MSEGGRDGAGSHLGRSSTKSKYYGPAGEQNAWSSNEQKASVNFFVLPVFVLQVVGLACLWALFYYLRFTNVFPFHRRVFQCSDAALSKPNLSPSRDSPHLFVSESTLYCVSFIVPPLVILIGEIMFWLFSTKPRKTVYVNCVQFEVHLFTRRCFRFISAFLFGALIVCIFIDSIKLITGYQRPYFLTLCNVSRSCSELNNHSPYLAFLRQCSMFRLSFPSVYAGLSSFSAIFASCYIHYMIGLRGAPLLRPFLIFGLLGMAMIASFSRIQAYKNHWPDIWWAWIIGGLTAIYSCHNVLCFQEIYRIKEEILPRQKISPFFSWFRLPRANLHKEPIYDLYPSEDDLVRERMGSSKRSRRRDNQRTYEVTTTTESFQRTIHPDGNNGHQNFNENGVY